MVFGTQTARPSAVVETPTNPTVTNLTVPLANTEVSVALVAVKKLSIRCRGTSVIQYAYILGDSGVLYLTIPRGKSEEIDGINFTGTLYLQTSEAAQVVEISQWV